MCVPACLRAPPLPPLQVTEAVCGGLRVEDKAEVLGLDSTSHGEQGYEMTPPAKLLAPQ